MTPPRIIQVTDLHLSREFPLFLMNWAVIAEHIVALRPDLVLATGDLTLADPDRDDDLVFAREKLDALGLPYRVVPGNYDTGDAPHKGLVGIGSNYRTISPERRARFRKIFGDDWWSERMGDWLLLGINAQLFGSSLGEAEDQRRFVKETLDSQRGGALLLVSHKPLFSRKHGADEPGWSIPKQDSEWLKEQTSRFRVRVCVSGHLHRDKRYHQSGIDFVWCPSTAYYSSHPRIEKRGGTLQVGALELELGSDELTIRNVHDDRLIGHDVRSWFNPGADALNRIISGPSPFTTSS